MGDEKRNTSRDTEMDENARRFGFGPLAFTFGTIRYYETPADAGAFRTAILDWFRWVRVRGFITIDRYVQTVDRGLGLVDAMDPKYRTVFDVDLGCLLGWRSETRHHDVYLIPAALVRFGLLSGFVAAAADEEERKYLEYFAETAPARAGDALGFSLPAEAHQPAAHSPVSRPRPPLPRETSAEAATPVAEADAAEPAPSDSDSEDAPGHLDAFARAQYEMARAEDELMGRDEAGARARDEADARAREAATIVAEADAAAGLRAVLRSAPALRPADLAAAASPVEAALRAIVTGDPEAALAALADALMAAARAAAH